MSGIRFGIDHTCDGQWRYYCEACSGLPDNQGIKGWDDTAPAPIVTEYAVRHIAEANIDCDNVFDTLHEAIEWVTEREEPDEWRLYQREITEWEEVE